jgi:hypothetical protein
MVEDPEAVVSGVDQSRGKARRVSTYANPSVSLAGYAPVRAVTTSTADTASTSSDVADEEEEDEDMAGVGNLIQDLAHSDNARVNTAFGALSLDLDNVKR